MAQTVDVTGLSPEAVRQVEVFVASLRRQGGTAPSPSAAAADRWRAAAEAVTGLANYDFDAWAEQRAFDRQHGGDNLK